MVLRTVLIIGLGLISFLVTVNLLQEKPERRSRPLAAAGKRTDNSKSGRPGPAPPGLRRSWPVPNSSIPEIRKDGPSAGRAGPLSLPPLSDYDILAMQSPAADSVRQQIRALVVNALFDGRSCLPIDRLGASRVLVVLKVFPTDGGVTVETVEPVTVFSGSALDPSVLDCLRRQIPVPARVSLSPTAALPAGSVHVLLTLQGKHRTAQ